MNQNTKEKLILGGLLFLGAIGYFFYKYYVQDIYLLFLDYFNPN